MMRTRFALALILALAVSCANPNKKVPPPGKPSEPPPATGPMAITSPAFANGGAIPQKYTCNGASVNPPLEFVNVPQTAHSRPQRIPVGFSMYRSSLCTRAHGPFRRANHG